jgi:2-haloalkanoic acid dehalogenase type II
LERSVLKVIAFDVFGTVFDLSAVNRSEVRDYVRHIKQDEWQPLQLPSHWERLPAHPDSHLGIERLRQRYLVVTLSNGPLPVQMALSRHNGICWDAIIPLEAVDVYKPNPRAYMYAIDLLQVKPSEVLMVTANEKFGDLEASRALGMEAILIRGSQGPKTIIELAERLGC